MGEVLAFRRPEENCTNCWYYTSHRNGYYIRHPAFHAGNCRHPDRTKDFYPGHPLVERVGLHCDPGQWCPKYVNIDSPAMKKLQFVSGIKFVLLCMQQRPKSHSTDVEKTNEYSELVDQFYQENKKRMTINQYKAAKRDPGYFSFLMEEITAYYKKKSKSRRQL